MLKGVIALMLGGIIGFSMAALVMVIPKDEEEIKRNWLDYQCRINAKCGCNDVCCLSCEKYNECTMKCDGNPRTCGQGYIIFK